MAEYDPKTKTWRADVSIKGKRYRKRGFLEQNHAEIWEGQQRWKYERKLVDLPVRDDYRIENAFQAYLEYVREHKRNNTYKATMRAIVIWQRFNTMHGIRDCSDLTLNTWDEFRSWRGNTANQTLNKDLGVIRRALAFAKKRGLIEKNPFASCETLPEKKTGMPRFFSVQEIADIEEYAAQHSPYFHDAFAVLVRTGLRVGELCALNLRNIDLQNNVIVLNPGQTKGNRLRVVPMAGKAREIITRLYQNAMADGREILFVTRDLTPQTGNNLYHRLLRVLRKLPTINKQGVNIHTCRKTYISQAVMAGADPTKIMAIVGHQDWATMRVYLALSPAYLTQSVSLPF